MIHSFKVVQLAKIMLARVMNLRDYRVPLEDYQANLTAMLNELKVNNVIPVLIAAPAGYTGNGMPSWAFDFYREYYRMSAEEIKNIPATHKAYAAVVAKVAKDSKAVFVDAQEHFNRLSPSLDAFFRNDLIHLTDNGHQAMAEEIYQQMSAYNRSNNLSWQGLGKPRAGE
jgi:lysophospholipase L1-like esterase